MVKYIPSMDEFVRKPKEPKINLDLNQQQDGLSTLKDVPNNSSEQSSRRDAQRPEKSKSKFSFKVPVPKNKKQWILTIIAIIAALSVTVFAIYWFILKDSSEPEKVQQAIQEPAVDPGPQPIYSKTSGREVDAATNDRSVYAVQIENSPEARPQSGLVNADIVSEAIAEGGITRFNAIYHDSVPSSLGPVRSLRPYFIDWFMPYDAAIVHAGGSGEALADIKALSLKDIDHGNSGSIFKRSPKRYSPHNLYTTGAQVSELMTQRGYTSNVKASLERKKPEPIPTPSAKNIALNISRPLYAVNFTYDPASNSYLRAQGGGAHVDADTGQQIAPNVVVVPVMGRRLHPNRVNTHYDTVGGGQVFVFQDGTVTEGSWTKTSRDSQWELKNASGEIIKLNPGQTWFTMIESADRVSYTP